MGDAVTIRLGFVGLGTASKAILHAVSNTHGVELTAVADIRSEALDAAARSYPGISLFDDAAELAKSPNVDAVWLATPNVHHAEHAVSVAQAGKHVIGEKPMAISVAECDRIVEAVESNGVKYVQGHSKLYGAGVRRLGTVLQSGELGRVIQIQSFQSKNWTRLPRLATELDTNLGGGVVYRQGPHQIDIVRYYGGGVVSSVQGRVGRHGDIDVDGDYTAFLEFDNGATACASFFGYGHFDASELTWDIGEGGRRVLSADEGFGNKALSAPVDADAKYRWADERESHDRSLDHAELFQPFFGLTIVTCERGAVRQSPLGVYLYRDGVRREIRLDPPIRHAAEIYELQRAIEDGDDPFPGARWGRATVAVCTGILESSKTKTTVTPAAQTDIPAHVTENWPLATASLRPD